jgi:hypothetical protein
LLFSSRKANLIFEFKVALKGTADFGGPFVQGPRERFVYVDIGTLAGQQDTQWSRRLKIPLTGISSRSIERASAGGKRRARSARAGNRPGRQPGVRERRGF